MGYEVETTQRDLSKKFEHIWQDAKDLITKNYLSHLSKYQLIQPSQEDKSIDILKCGEFYRLHRLVRDPEENFADKLVTVMNVAYSMNCSVATLIRSEGREVQHYIGLVAKADRGKDRLSEEKRKAAFEAFKGALGGNLTGSELRKLETDELENLRGSLFEREELAISSVSGVTSMRQGEKREIHGYIQGMENLTEALQGKKYSIWLIADPIKPNELENIRRGYEIIYSQMIPYLSMSMSINEGESTTLSKAQTEGTAEAISAGISLTQSKSFSTSESSSRNRSFSVGGGVIIPPFGVHIGGSWGRGESSGSTSGTSSGETRTKSENRQTSSSHTESRASGQNRGKNLQLNYQNREVRSLLDRIEKQLERLETCENFGGFHCAAYIIGENRQEVLTAAGNYNAMMRGENSYLQSSHINTWDKKEDVKILAQYLKSGIHPNFRAVQEEGRNSSLVVTPASVMNSRELAVQTGLPQKSINGIPVIEIHSFGRNIPVKAEPSVYLGNLFHMGKEEETIVQLDTQSLAMHALITGSTGSGKSNTLYGILEQLNQQGIKFLVIEPAKGEYKHIFGNRSDVSVLGTNPAHSDLLRINPFAFPKGIHVLEHIDRLVEIFNVCWPMYAAMPAVLKEAVLLSYENCGWDLEDSLNIYGTDVFPTFADLKLSLTEVIKSSSYSEEVKSNYTGALITRVNSLVSGLNGQIFSSFEMDDKKFFEENVIVDLSRIGSMETKSLIMGILVMRLAEYRMSEEYVANKKLQHVTVLEEAHNLLKRSSPESSAEGSGLLAKSVEMISNAIAEMRAYGEGFLIVDQSPSAVDMSAVRNTNTKIILRLPEESDRRLSGRAAALKEEQLSELARLPKGIAAVYQNDWLEPVLCRVKRYQEKDTGFRFERIREDGLKNSDKRHFKSELLRWLLQTRSGTSDPVEFTDLKKNIRELMLSGRLQMELGKLLEEYKSYGDLRIWKTENFDKLSRLVMDLLDCRESLSKVVYAVSDFQSLRKELQDVVLKHTEGLSERVVLDLIHCFLKEMSLYSQKNFEIYAAWKNEMESGSL